VRFTSHLLFPLWVWFWAELFLYFLKRENAVECETMNMQLKRELQEAGVLSSKARQSEPQIDNVLYHWTGFVHSLGLISSEGRKLTP
jgi:hypothetical protein